MRGLKIKGQALGSRFEGLHLGLWLDLGRFLIVPLLVYVSIAIEFIYFDPWLSLPSQGMLRILSGVVIFSLGTLGFAKAGGLNVRRMMAVPIALNRVFLSRIFISLLVGLIFVTASRWIIIANHLPNSSMGAFFKQTKPLIWVMIPLLLVHATGEELFFRGLCHGRIRESYGPISASVICGLLFAGLHLPDFFHFFRLFSASILITLAFESWGSLVYAIAVHAGVNCAGYMYVLWPKLPMPEILLFSLIGAAILSCFERRWARREKAGREAPVAAAACATIPLLAGLLVALPSLAGSAPHPGAAGSAKAVAAGIEWVTIPGGGFMMGRADGYDDTKPVHEVTIRSFEISKSKVTVEQFERCVRAGKCTEPREGDLCNWKTKRRRHPVNCVSWWQAVQFAKFEHARLPSEAEWEYAARSGGKNQKYPWGDEAPDCGRAVIGGCGPSGTREVCTKASGNTLQGLCDMTGNVWEWVQDIYKGTYENAPTDGSAAVSRGLRRVMRGGSFDGRGAGRLQATNRRRDGAGANNDYVGFRLARDIVPPR